MLDRIMNKKICILNYGSGNIYSLVCALKRLDIDFIVTDEKEKIINSSHLIIPGVGSFDSCMNKISGKNLLGLIEDFRNTDKPILGICVGMQILATFGFENNKSKGLDFISGDVDIISKNIKLPHIGWNNLKILSKNKLTENVNSEDYFYFVHSYGFKTKNYENVLTTTEYAEINFASIVTDNNNIYGTQFHPEKSQISGLKILNNFINI